MRSLAHEHFVVAEHVYRAGALLLGRFKLSSGGESTVYLDLRRLLAHPDALDVISSLAAAKLEESLRGFDAVVGIATGGIAWATLIAYKLRKPAGYVRLARKGHGTDSVVEGWKGPGKAVIVDDVATTGSSIVEAARVLRGSGVDVAGALVIVDREQGAGDRVRELGLKFVRLATLRQILEYGVSSGRVPQGEAQWALKELEGVRGQ
ncbi:MAG: orotate phosphoribosyltransferase [Thermoproteota archaeon]